MATEEEIREAALQFVRKVSGIRKPTDRTAEAFDRAVAETAAITEQLLNALPPSKAQPVVRPRRREVTAAEA